jgi:mannose-6-phosphate isomerase-like protein (cupin superfamily)
MIVRRASVEPIDFGGLQILDYTVGRDAGSSLAVIEVPPGGRHQEAYSQRSDKYYYIVAGQVSFSLNGEEHDLIEGDLCVVDKGQRFSYVNRTPDAARLLLVHTPTFQLDSEVFVG